MGVKFNTSESSSLNSDYPKSMAVPNQYGFGGLSAHKVISAASTNLDFIKKVEVVYMLSTFIIILVLICL